MLRMEFWGGLGDTLHRLYHTNWYDRLEKLEGDERAEITIISHNPHVSELFRWHPKGEHFDLRSFKFHHPLDDHEWRQLHRIGPMVHTGTDGLPEPVKGRRYYPTNVEKTMENPPGRFIIFSASAGTMERSIPKPVCDRMVNQVVDRGFTAVIIGRNYVHAHELPHPLHQEVPIQPGPKVLNLTDKISIPKTLTMIQQAAGVVAAHSAMCLASWFEGRPTFLAYDDNVRDKIIPLGPVGYMCGMGKPGNDQVHFNEYSAEQFDRWLESL